jgi:site-specific DNA-methyltransferase (adenine-specific)
VNKHPDSFQHPAQKPVALFRWILQSAPQGIVLDPYAGSGSTLVASKELGRPAVGVEIDERYCEIAANRLAQDAFDFEAAS